MHDEYAVEPDAIASNWESCRYLSEKFGFDRGRIISMFPKQWAKEAINSIDSNLGDIEKKKIREKVLYLKRYCSISSGRHYCNETNSWLESAIKQQKSNPFHAIIATKKSDSECSCVLTLNEIEENHPKFLSHSTRRISRDKKSLLNAFDVLLRSENKVVFIDPYFSFFDAGYISLLSCCLRVISESHKSSKCNVYIHFSAGKRGSDIGEIERSSVVNSLKIPSNIILKVFSWNKKDQGDDLHDRYLLTEKGGIHIGRGFKPAKITLKTALSLVGRDASLEMLKSFERQSGDYLLEGAICIDSSGRIVRI